MANSIIDSFFMNQEVKSKEDFSNVLREVSQKIILISLYKSGFFIKASFYGGTCLRIFHNLQRFSENLDFECKQPFKYEDFITHIKKASLELKKFGIIAEPFFKTKFFNTTVMSAYIDVYPKNLLNNTYYQTDEKLSIKVEVETKIYKSAKYEINNIFLPIIGKIDCYDLPTLFSGKLCAVLYRSWGNRVKGRDYFDLYFYLANKTPINYDYLNEKSRDLLKISENEIIDKTTLKEMLIKKIETLDFRLVKDDVKHFIKDEMFYDILDKDVLISLIESF